MDDREFFAKLAAASSGMNTIKNNTDNELEEIDVDNTREETGEEPKEEPKKIKAETEADLKPVKKSAKPLKKNLKKELEEERKIQILEEWECFQGPEGVLTIDVYQTPISFIIESHLAGVKGDHIDISITSDSVTIKGFRKKEEQVEKEDYLFSECFWGKFSRSIILPQEIDPDKAQASLKNGVLKIVLPKLNRQKEKKIKVNFN